MRSQGHPGLSLSLSNIPHCGGDQLSFAMERPTECGVYKLVSRLQMGPQLLPTSQQQSEETESQDHPGLSSSWTPIPQKLCEIISVCCFKLVNYRLICCTAIINNNVLHKIKVTVSNNSNIQLMCPRSPRAASTTCPLDDGVVEEVGWSEAQKQPLQWWR